MPHSKLLGALRVQFPQPPCFFNAMGTVLTGDQGGYAAEQRPAGVRPFYQ